MRKSWQLESADTAEKLKKLMEDERGTVFGSIAKLHMARRALTVDGLEKLGTDSEDNRSKAAASVQQARDYFAELTKEFKQSDEPALLQESWVGLAQAEETLVGLPTAKGGSDSRGDATKAIDAYTKAAAIFPDAELSKKYAARAKELTDNKAAFIDAQKAFYAAPAETKLELPKVGTKKNEPTAEPKKDEPKTLEVPNVAPPPADPKTK